MTEAVAKRKIGLTTMILLSLVVGLVVGIILNNLRVHGGVGAQEFIDSYLINGLLLVFGKIFISSIKMLVVPLVLISLIVGVTGIGDLSKLGRVGGKTLFFYLLTTALAISIAIILAKFMNPGMGVNLSHAGSQVVTKEAPPFAQVLINIIPTNPFKSMVEGNMLQVIFFSLLAGISIAALGKKAKSVLVVFEELNEVIMKMISFIMLMAPIGVFCLISKVFATQGLGVLLPLAKYMITVILALMIHLLFVYSGALKVVSRLSVVMFFKKFYSTLLVAFSTASSNATIPVTMRTVTEKLGVSKSISSFSIPFGATINMDGTAIMQGVAVVFISQVYGIQLGVTEFLTVIMTATLASIGTAGVPGVGLITLSMVLTQVGLPVEGIALIFGVDRLLDMSRTAVNISGDAIVSIIVAKSEGEFDPSVYNNPDAGKEEDDIDDLEKGLHETHDLYVEDQKRLHKDD